jgi:hypothetical protein
MNDDEFKDRIRNCLNAKDVPAGIRLDRIKRHLDIEDRKESLAALKSGLLGARVVGVSTDEDGLKLRLKRADDTGKVAVITARGFQISGLP